MTNRPPGDREPDVKKLQDALRGLLAAAKDVRYQLSPTEPVYPILDAAVTVAEVTLGDVMPAWPPMGDWWRTVNCMWCHQPGPHPACWRLGLNMALVLCGDCEEYFQATRWAPDRGRAGAMPRFDEVEEGRGGTVHELRPRAASDGQGPPEADPPGRVHPPGPPRGSGRAQRRWPGGSPPIYG